MERARAEALERAVRDARAEALAATRGDAVAAMGALVSASERVAIARAGGARAGGTRDASGSGADECSVGEGDGGVDDADGTVGTGVDGRGVRVRDRARASASEEEGGGAEATATAGVRRARAETGLGAFEFENGSRGVEALSESGMTEDALAQVEYSSRGWETAPDFKSQRSRGTSAGDDGRGAPSADVWSRFGGERRSSELEGAAVAVGFPSGSVPAAVEDDDAGSVDETDSENDYAGGTQAVENSDDDHDDHDDDACFDDEAVAGTQLVEEYEDEFLGGTQVIREAESEEAKASPKGRSTPTFLRIAPASVTPPGAKSAARRIEASPRDGNETLIPRSLWAAAASTPPEERARRGNFERPNGIAEDASAPATNAITQATQPTMAIGDEGTNNDSRRVECTPLDAVAAPLLKPPALKRPGVIEAHTNDSSMVTESARPMGSVGSEPIESFGVARTAIEAVKRAKARQNAPLGVDASMPQLDSERHEDAGDEIVEATPVVEETIEEDEERDDDDREMTPPSSPDLGLFYSQRRLEEEPQQTQHSVSPLKVQRFTQADAEPLTQPEVQRLTQPEVDSPITRIMLSQHQWRQPRRRAPPPPKFEEDTPPRKRLRIIDDDLSQPLTQTQPTQEQMSPGGEFVECTQQETEGGLLRSRLTRLPAQTISQRNQLRIIATSPPAAHTEITPSKDEEARELPTLGCPKCRYSRGGCGRCREILENAKKGIWPKRRGRPSTGSASVASASVSRASKQQATPSVSKTPASKTPASVKTKISRSQEKAVDRRSRKMFASMNFLLSGLQKPLVAATTALIREHGGNVLAEPTSSVPVNSVIVITPTMGRTMKCLYGIAAGARFATPSWIEACVDARELVDLDEPLDADGQPRDKHRSCAGKLFRDVKTAITGNEAFMKDFSALLSHAGAEIELNPQTAERFDYLIIQSGEKPHAAWLRASKRLDVPCVRHEWLVDSILCGELLASEAFAVDAAIAQPLPQRESAPASSDRDRRKSCKY